MDVDMKICEATAHNSELWHEERQQRITASRFGKVVSARSEESFEKLAKKIKTPWNQNENSFLKFPLPCRIGIHEEENARRAYVKYQREIKGLIVHVAPVGLCVPNANRQIGSTPDGIVSIEGQDSLHILEIKCIVDRNPVPRSILEIAKERGPRFYCTIDREGNYTLKKTHAYYYQVLGEMATTGLPFADFVIYHPRTEEIKVLRIEFHLEDWKKLESKLKTFISTYFSREDISPSVE